ncbi:hypothetical protein [Georgenia sp. Z1491]|uniref:hypothetical protein n=1 Tax=Georgenia sp. Z1491 TaxID=3416707 RepID=UPI003CF091FB
MRARAWMVGAAVVGVVGAGLFRPVRFPRPGGPFGVGTTSRHWVDRTRTEILSSEPGEVRELVAQVWYPTTASRGERSIYLADAPDVFASLLQALGEVTGGRTSPPFFLFRKLARSRTNAIIIARVVRGIELPVIVTAHTILAEALASHGYVVVGVDQPFVSARTRLADGRVVRMRRRGHLYDGLGEDEVIAHLAVDVSVVLDEIARDPVLARTSSTGSAGVVGVSLGGTVAAAAARTDPRIAACLMMDAAMPASVAADGIPCAALWLTRPAEDMRRERRRAGGWPEEVIEKTLGSMRAALARQSPGTGRLVSIPGMFHIDFTDAPHWFPWARWVGLSGPIGARCAHRIINRSAECFFTRAQIGGG